MAQKDKEGDKKKKESILELQKLFEKPVLVKFSGGREVTGILKGFDQLINLVLDDTVEQIQASEEDQTVERQTRKLGLVVCRGTTVIMICPVDGMKQIENPFAE